MYRTQYTPTTTTIQKKRQKRWIQKLLLILHQTTTCHIHANKSNRRPGIPKKTWKQDNNITRRRWKYKKSKNTTRQQKPMHRQRWLPIQTNNTQKIPQHNTIPDKKKLHHLPNNSKKQ